MRPHPGPGLLALALATAAACGGSSGPARTAEGGPGASNETLGKVKGADVYDADGRATACEQPGKNCPDTPPDTPFLDRCRLGGYQVRQCGCARLCSGDVSAAKRYFDASGNSKDCAPAQGDCEAAAASAAFQDACSDRGFKLAQCGCEWLCSGNTSK